MSPSFNIAPHSACAESVNRWVECSGVREPSRDMQAGREAAAGRSGGHRTPRHLDDLRRGLPGPGLGSTPRWSGRWCASTASCGTRPSQRPTTAGGPGSGSCPRSPTSPPPGSWPVTPGLTPRRDTIGALRPPAVGAAAMLHAPLRAAPRGLTDSGSIASGAARRPRRPHGRRPPGDRDRDRPPPAGTGSRRPALGPCVGRISRVFGGAGASVEGGRPPRGEPGVAAFPGRWEGR
jgi:hypothetical protein